MPTTGASRNSSSAITTPTMSNASGSHGYLVSRSITHAGALEGTPALAAWSIVTTPGGTTFGGAALTSPALTRASRF